MEGREATRVAAVGHLEPLGQGSLRPRMAVGMDRRRVGAMGLLRGIDPGSVFSFMTLIAKEPIPLGGAESTATQAA